MSEHDRESGPLTAEQERQLARLVEAGIYAERCVDQAPPEDLEAWHQVIDEGKRAWRELYEGNVGIVHVLATRWARLCVLPREDLFQEGAVALGEALRRWDYQRGWRASTYLWAKVEGAMRHAVATRCGQSGLNHGQAALVRKVRQTQETLSQRDRRACSLTRAADHLGLDPQVIARLHHAQAQMPIEYAHREMVVFHDDMVRPVISVAWLAHLPRADREILRARFGIGVHAKTRAALAEEWGISSSTIARWEERALKRARSLMEEAAA